MSARRSAHAALAAAGLLTGLPAAAALQWTRPDPGMLWYDASDGESAEKRFALNESGSRFTLIRLRVQGSRGRAVALRPRCLNAVAARFGGTPRWEWYRGGAWGLFGGDADVNATVDATDWWTERPGDWRCGEISWYCIR